MLGLWSLQYVGVMHCTDELMRSAMFLHQRAQLLFADALSCEQRMFTRRMAAKTQTRSKEANGCKPRPQRVRLKFYRMARMMPQPRQEKMGVRMVKWPPWHQTCPTKSHFFLCSAARSDFGLQRQHCGQEAATLTLCHGGGDDTWLEHGCATVP